MGWGLAIPALRMNHRLAEGFKQRTLKHKMPPAADLWIQAASAGESYLAWELLKGLRPARPVRVMVTSNTSQGMEILERAIDDITPNDRGVSACAAYFPFDKPTIMETAVRNISSKIMVLLESEMWPGLLAALKKYRCKTLIINGRITAKSLRRYLIWPSLWRDLRPDKILAVSEKDAKRFSVLFGREYVDVMPNMKFDRISLTQGMPYTKNPLEGILRPDTPLLVLGSVRREEEPVVEKIVVDIHRRLPETIIGLFPRHMHRIKYWKKVLDRLAIPWTLRSKIQKHVPHGTVILWDTFGELPLAYELSKAAFVGGSLAPLGGQNFLEALTCGVVPVIGPSWENFAWVGQEIVEQGLVRNATNWKEVTDILVETMEKSPSYEKVRETALRYVEDRQGGTTLACRLVAEFLNNT
ncbi:MAG: 3-deoxy-D-manno-octulosonic acid transferase [Deltaproteobacteria bacterium]|nr:3-deoxy-D-manno-octulosonic acid transferase [Deltaproteobacteria bacterium]